MQMSTKQSTSRHLYSQLLSDKLTFQEDYRISIVGEVLVHPNAVMGSIGAFCYTTCMLTRTGEHLDFQPYMRYTYTFTVARQDIAGVAL